MVDNIKIEVEGRRLISEAYQNFKMAEEKRKKSNPILYFVDDVYFNGRSDGIEVEVVSRQKDWYRTCHRPSIKVFAQGEETDIINYIIGINLFGDLKPEDVHKLSEDFVLMPDNRDSRFGNINSCKLLLRRFCDGSYLRQLIVGFYERRLEKSF